MRASRSGFITEYKATYMRLFITKRTILTPNFPQKSPDLGFCCEYLQEIKAFWMAEHAKNGSENFWPLTIFERCCSMFSSVRSSSATLFAILKFRHVTKMRDDWHRTGILQVLNACKTSPTCFRFSVHDIILTSIKALISLFQRESQTFERWCSFNLPLWRQSFFTSFCVAQRLQSGWVQEHEKIVFEFSIKYLLNCIEQFTCCRKHRCNVKT